MRENITKKQLKQIYEENTNIKACELLGVSKATFIKMIDDAGIERKGKGYAQKYLIV